MINLNPKLVETNNEVRNNFIIQSFIFLVLVKVVYIYLEYFYNLNIFDIASSKDFYNETKINELNDIGHKISAIGISLLLTPLFSFILNKIKSIYTRVFTYFLIFITIFVIAYNSLDKLIDYIVKQNLDKSYEAYYLNIFKIGLYENYFKYDSFIKSDHLINNTLTVEDKLLFINSFILLNADKELLSKLQQQGKNHFLSIYIDQNKSDFEKEFKKYITLDNEIKNKYNDFNNERKKIKDTLGKSSNINVNDLYKELENSLKIEYSKQNQKILDSKNVLNDKKGLIRMFEAYYSNPTKYQKDYNNKMNNIFGEVLDPDLFLDNSGSFNIRIFEDVLNERQREMPSFSNFVLLPKVQSEIIKTLKNKGLRPNSNVNYYDKESLSNLINNKVNLENNSIEKNFKSTLKDKLGDNDLTLSMDYDQFIKSKYIKSKMNDYLKEFNLSNNFINNIYKVLSTKDELKENAFKEEIYINIIKESKLIEKYMFTKEDFNNNEEAKKYGELAIKLLYIPMFALLISMVSLLLNTISLINMIIFNNGTKKMINNKVVFLSLKGVIFLILLAITIYLPFNTENVVLNNIKAFNLDTNSYYYLKFLEFINYYEKLIYQI